MNLKKQIARSISKVSILVLMSAFLAIAFVAKLLGYL